MFQISNMSIIIEQSHRNVRILLKSKEFRGTGTGRQERVVLHLGTLGIREGA